MGRRTFTAAEKLELAQGWIVARDQGESQQSYATRHDTTARRVRECAAEFTPPGTPVEEARRILHDAIEQLQTLLASLNAGAGAARPPALATTAPSTMKTTEPARRSAEECCVPASSPAITAPTRRSAPDEAPLDNEPHRRVRADDASDGAGDASQAPATTDNTVTGVPTGGQELGRRRSLFEKVWEETEAEE